MAAKQRKLTSDSARFSYSARQPRDAMRANKRDNKTKTTENNKQETK